MALSKDKKTAIIADVSRLLAESRLTVIARYQGTPVKSMQELRRQASEDGTQVRVIKNRLFKKALAADERFKGTDGTDFIGQLLYAFNSQDEVAPAQSLARFAKTESQIEFVGALTADGTVLAPQDVKSLAALPGKDQLRAQLAGTIAAPLSSFVNVMAGNIRGVLNVLTARAEQLN
ncbi:MAG: 50S ribosomal protein L10 [Candidatus Saccharimonadales bacterium]